MVTVESIIDENIDRLTDSKCSQDEALTIMRNWDGYQFEKFWAELKRRDGYAARPTRESGDRGVDVVASLRVDSESRRITLAQTKCYSNRVSAHHIEKYDYLTNYGNEVEFVTTGNYSNATEERAHELGITLIGPEEIYELIRDTNSWDLLVENPLTTSPRPRSPRSIDTLVGIALGAGDIAHSGGELKSLDPNKTAQEAFIEAIRALFRHGFIDLEILRGNYEEDESPFIFVSDPDYEDGDPELPDVEGVLIPLIEGFNGDWYVRAPSNHPESLMSTLIGIIRHICRIMNIPVDEPNPDANVWY